MARLCLACQTTVENRAEHCTTCGRSLREIHVAWSAGRQAWLSYLEQTGWYPGRRDEWVDRRLYLMATAAPRQRTGPIRLSGRYLGGHPGLLHPGRVILTRDVSTVQIGVPTWWRRQQVRAVIPLDAIISVQVQRTIENTLDETVVTAAIGGARTGPLGMAFGAAIGRRRRVVRTIHVHMLIDQEPTELIFRPLDDHSPTGLLALARIFKPE